MDLPLLALILTGACEFASGARIIMATPQFGSHVFEQAHLGEELVSRGHEVYIAIANRYPKRQDIEKKGIKTLQYKIPDDVLFGVSEEMEQKLTEVVFLYEKEKLEEARKVVSQIGSRDCALMMDDKSFLKQAKELNFSLAIIEPFVLSPCYLILPKYLDIPFVSMAILFQPWSIRVPALPSFIPLFDVWTEPTDIGLFSKLKNLALYIGLHSGMVFPENTSLLQDYAPDVHYWNDLLLQSDLFLFGSDHHFNAPIPQMPNCVSAAGLTTTKAKKLPEDLHQLMEQSTDGVILLSFGSSASYFSEHVIVKFLDAFSKLSQTVIAKFVIPENVNIPKNVKVLKWLPQNDILGHPKTKIFITHCGLHGIYETLYHGVPIIGMPLFADQDRNCLRGFKKGFGLEMKIQNFTSSELINNIKEILNNPKYRLAIQKASEIFRDQPMHPKDRTVFWIEHVIRHGGKHLRTLAMDMPLYQFLMLDIIGALILGVALLLIVFRLLLRWVWKLCFTPRVEPGLKLKSS